MKRRVVVSGIGVVSPNGIGLEFFWNNSLRGNSGVERATAIDAKDFPTGLSAEVKGFDPEQFIFRNNPSCMDITSQFATAAATLAVKDSGLSGNDNILGNAGVAIGTTLGTISFILDQEDRLKGGTYKSIDRNTGYTALHNSISGDVSIELKAYGVSETISSACISGLSSLVYGVNKIRYEDYDVMIVGGADSCFRPLPYAGLNIIHLLTDTALRPFDVNGDGTVLGEGAAMLVLENLDHARKRKAKTYCEILGTEMTCESNGYFSHEKNPIQATRAIESAIVKSDIDKGQIDFINTHGLGVKGSDRFESDMYRQYFGEKMCGEKDFSSIKPYIGHPLAAASAFQIAYTAMMMENKVILPTLNHEVADDNCVLRLVKGAPKAKNIRYALINANAFGGKCAACVLKK